MYGTHSKSYKDYTNKETTKREENLIIAYTILICIVILYQFVSHI